jgi:hypothetical protein
MVGAAAMGSFALANNPVTGAHMDDRKVEASVRSTLAARGVAGATVDCPSLQPARTNYQFICTLSLGGERAHVLVTVLNTNGDFTWVVTA